MKYALNMPNFGSYGDVRALAAFAREAEDAGWDGFFIWDHISSAVTQQSPANDPWIALTAIALNTERIRLGAMITPVARRRPWVLARQTATLDQISNGRLIFGAGLGSPPEEFTTFGEDGDARVRGQKLDEGLDILAGLWSGRPFSYAGERYNVAETAFIPASEQQPRIPVWIAGMLPAKAPMRRAARWDGFFPIAPDLRVLSSKEIADVATEIRKHRSSDAPFDIAVGGESSPYGPFRRMEPFAAYEEAGVTWWMESLTDMRGTLDKMHDFVKAGPPRD